MELWIAAGLCAATMFALWLWQRGSGRADWVDVAWAALIGVQVLFFAIVGDGSIEKRALAVLVACSWSFRLTWHLSVRLAGHDEEDGRYQAMREAFNEKVDFGFLLFYAAQALVAWLFALPAWVVANDPSSDWTLLVFAGLAFWVVSLLGESIADRQLAAFKKDPSNKGKVCEVGLWGWSRHPNYFFEWLHWFACPLIAWGAPNHWVAWLGPVVMLLFLYRVSGIPYTEQQSIKSRGDAYRDYQRRVSAFFPWPPDRESSH